MLFLCAVNDNVGETHVFIKQIFKATEKAPPLPLPLALCWGGVGLALFSHKPWLLLWF
jgi:hypothetical protein